MEILADKQKVNNIKIADCFWWRSAIFYNVLHLAEPTFCEELFEWTEWSRLVSPWQDAAQPQRLPASPFLISFLSMPSNTGFVQKERIPSCWKRLLNRNLPAIRRIAVINLFQQLFQGKSFPFLSVLFSSFKFYNILRFLFFSPLPGFY